MVKPLKTKAKNYLKQRGFYQELLNEKKALEETNRKLERKIEEDRNVTDYHWFVEPGHFYSPLFDENTQDFSQLIDLRDPVGEELDLPGISLNKKGQAALLKELVRNSKEYEEFLKKSSVRFKDDNDQFGKSDGSILYLMLRLFKPARIMEVGSGWSSALMLDVNEHYPKQAADLTFIDPFPERLYNTLKPKDKKHCKIISERVQTVDFAEFEKLDSGDLLFIDNSHVSKTGSDVNYLVFEVLPRLKSGVIVHIHDIFYPFEYPLQWVDERRNWNEAYVVRALLTGSSMFEIIMWSSYFLTVDPVTFRKQIPTAKDFGSSLWLRKC